MKVKSTSNLRSVMKELKETVETVETESHASGEDPLGDFFGYGKFLFHSLVPYNPCS